MNWKQIIWIVIYATIVAVIRQSGGIESNWVWWILALVFVAIYEALATKKDQQQQATDTPQNADSSTQNLAAVPQKDNDADSEESSKEALPESEGGYPLSIMSKIIREYCAERYDKMIDFHITLDTNFQKDLHFDGIDFAEICIRLEKEFSVELPEDSSLNNRPAEDTDFTVGEFLKEYRLLGGKSCDKASDSANDIRTDDIMLDKSDHAQKQIITKDFNVNGISFRMICVKGGSFVMGENQEDVIPHKVTIDKDYWIGETPVTQELWNAVMGYNNSHAYLKLNNAPVGNVSWLECEKFINTLSKITGKTFSFPTEAQWEFAARGGIFSKGYCYSGGDNIDDVAWYWDNCDKKVHAVKTKKPNELGIYDMSGSVWEWCYDWADKYDGKDVINPTGPEEGEYKIIRGGCLENNPPACAVTARSLLPPTKNHPLAGLRLAFSESSENSISESPNHNRADDVMAKNDLSANVQQTKTIKNFKVNGVAFSMVCVDSGTFMMGSNDGKEEEQPVHPVTLSNYCIGQTLVTQELWQAVMGNNPSCFKGEKHPVERVTWNDCMKFIQKLNSLTRQRFRLPTEAEWEFAARGGNHSKGYKFAGSDTIEKVAWFDDNAGDKLGEDNPDYGTHDVATKSPNELGIYDMTGNVAEWCSDRYGKYSKHSQTDPHGPSSSEMPIMVFRGGAWDDDDDRCRVTFRSFDLFMERAYNIGFRLAL